MKTAVELLEDAINEVLSHLPLEREEIKMLIEKAKQKEKEQMIDLAYHIKHLYSFKEHSKLTLDEMVEHHYNSNFKSE